MKNQNKFIQTLKDNFIKTEHTIGGILVALILTAVLITVKFTLSTLALVSMWTAVGIIFIAGLYFAVKLDAETGSYKCSKCGHLHKPSFKQILNAMHMGTTRYLKCPECGKYSWSKKNLDK